MNDFNVTEKSKLMEQVETFSLRSFFKCIYLMTVLCSHKKSLKKMFLIKISFVGGQFIPAISKLSDGIERLLKLQPGKIAPWG